MELVDEPDDVAISYPRNGREITDRAVPMGVRDGMVEYHLQFSDRDVLVPDEEAQDPERAAAYIERELDTSENGEDYQLAGVESL